MYYLLTYQGNIDYDFLISLLTILTGSRMRMMIRKKSGIYRNIDGRLRQNMMQKKRSGSLC